jgi:hypothetical protein
LVETAHDADAVDVHLDVLRHEDLDAAHDGPRVDRHLRRGEPRLPQIQLTTAPERHRVERLGHDPRALALKAAHDADSER